MTLGFHRLRRGGPSQAWPHARQAALSEVSRERVHRAPCPAQLLFFSLTVTTRNDEDKSHSQRDPELTHTWGTVSRLGQGAAGWAGATAVRATRACRSRGTMKEQVALLSQQPRAASQAPVEASLPSPFRQNEREAAPRGDRKPGAKASFFSDFHLRSAFFFFSR